jgi:hypothetical protein
MARPRKVAVLQVNESPTPVVVPDTNFLTEEQILEAMQPYEKRGVKIDITDTHWFLTLHKNVCNIHGKVIGGGEVKASGNRKMPVKDLIYSANELLVPITPITQNPA